MAKAYITTYKCVYLCKFTFCDMGSIQDHCGPWIAPHKGRFLVLSPATKNDNRKALNHNKQLRRTYVSTKGFLVA